MNREIEVKIGTGTEPSRDGANLWGADIGANDAELAKVLSDFRLSVHAWSKAEYNRPRVATRQLIKTGHRAVIWALGCVLAVSVAGGSLYERHHHQELARVAAEQQARKHLVMEQRAKETEDLLARVDKDVSQQVPDAMEPLAQLMDDDGSR